MLADSSLVWLSSERLCQHVTNTDADTQSLRTAMDKLGEWMKELKGIATP
jgi:hypothetical protein|uniref:ASL1/AK132805 fusion protein n=1 Tax=Mus musculus TaxID=10090 RepID=C6EQH9_MOUSE|nr:ASL1/AK132805 fusion protein [Mus musculus]